MTWFKKREHTYFVSYYWTRNYNDTIGYGSCTTVTDRRLTPDHMKALEKSLCTDYKHDSVIIINIQRYPL